MKRLIPLMIAFALFPFRAMAQDIKPTQVQGETEVQARNRQLSKLHGIQVGDTEFKYSPTRFPKSFTHIQPNHMLNGEALAPFFEKVAERHTKSVRVVQIGDSHVRGHVLPREVRLRLEEAWGSDAMQDAHISYKTSAIAIETGTPGFVFSALAKNGVTLAYFEDEKMQEEIADLHPDLLIISLGTNESHAPSFDARDYVLHLDAFCRQMRERCPGVQFLLTTPPGSHTGAKRRVKRRGRWVTTTGSLTPNSKTPEVVNAQLEFATTHHIPLWNLYELAGGSSYACDNWRNGNLMATDGVHYTPDGYTLQGHLLAEAILNEWNKYLTLP